MSPETPGGAYSERDRATVRVDCMRLDEFMLESGIDVADLGLVWIDTQGHEARVLAGATSVLRSRVPVVLEYWPYALKRAGTGDLELLHDLIGTHYETVVDLGASGRARSTVSMPARQVGHLQTLYRGTADTDLLLLNKRGFENE